MGVVISLGVAWWVWRRGQGPTNESQKMQASIYEEPLETAIHLQENEAYVPCQHTEEELAIYGILSVHNCV